MRDEYLIRNLQKVLGTFDKTCFSKNKLVLEGEKKLQMKRKPNRNVSKRLGFDEQQIVLR